MRLSDLSTSIHIPKLQLPKHIFWLFRLLPPLSVPAADHILATPPYLSNAHTAELDIGGKESRTGFQGSGR
jgi:hypothetical protein